MAGVPITFEQARQAFADMGQKARTMLLAEVAEEAGATGEPPPPKKPRRKKPTKTTKATKTPPVVEPEPEPVKVAGTTTKGPTTRVPAKDVAVAAEGYSEVADVSEPAPTRKTKPRLRKWERLMQTTKDAMKPVKERKVKDVGRAFFREARQVAPSLTKKNLKFLERKGPWLFRGEASRLTRVIEGNRMGLPAEEMEGLRSLYGRARGATKGVTDDMLKQHWDDLIKSLKTFAKGDKEALKIVRNMSKLREQVPRLIRRVRPDTILQAMAPSQKNPIAYRAAQHVLGWAKRTSPQGYSELTGALAELTAEAPAPTKEVAKAVKGAVGRGLGKAGTVGRMATGVGAGITGAMLGYQGYQALWGGPERARKMWMRGTSAAGEITSIDLMKAQMKQYEALQRRRTNLENDVQLKAAVTQAVLGGEGGGLTDSEIRIGGARSAAPNQKQIDAIINQMLRQLDFVEE
jgi:hypothetical protein